MMDYLDFRYRDDFRLCYFSGVHFDAFSCLNNMQNMSLKLLVRRGLKKDKGIEKIMTTDQPSNTY